MHNPDILDFEAVIPGRADCHGLEARGSSRAKHCHRMPPEVLLQASPAGGPHGIDLALTVEEPRTLRRQHGR
jgi:hypothetical protein